MSNNVLPSMSDQGWIRGAVPKADLMLSHLWIANSNQTYLYAGDVASVQMLIEEHTDDINSLMYALQSKLEQYFGRFFDDATATVDIDPSTALTNKKHLRIGLTLMQGELEFKVGDVVSIADGKFKSIMNANNYGT